MGNFAILDGWFLWRGDTNFATYDAVRVTPQFRIDWLISSKQDLRLLLQWVGIRAKAIDLYDRNSDGNVYVTGVDPVDHDFAIGSLAFQIRYRYELAPLSELYIVYARGGFHSGINDDGLQNLGSTFSDALDNITADQFMAKIRYRF